MSLELRVMELEDALYQAVSTIEFLHGCLTSDGYKYAYPEQTARRLKDFRELLPATPGGCCHSYHDSSCENCVWRRTRARKKMELRTSDS